MQLKYKSALRQNTHIKDAICKKSNAVQFLLLSDKSDKICLGSMLLLLTKTLKTY